MKTSSREENSDLGENFFFLTFFFKKAEKKFTSPTPKKKIKLNRFLSQMQEFWTLTSSGLQIEPELKPKNNLKPKFEQFWSPI